MSMVPFATKTDMIDALKQAGVPLNMVDAFLLNLLAEHAQPNARTQLLQLWRQHAEERFPKKRQEAVAATPGVSAALATPPDSPA